MEYVDGGTLADRLGQHPIPPAQAAAWAEAIARGIHAAHRRGVIHRDLKPANVLMTADGVPKITDFGIARRMDDPADRTRTGLVMGTPAYMAPEQAEGRKGVGPAADIWAVGAILYEMLTGRPPFTGETSLDLLRRVASENPQRPSRVRPGVPPALEAVCLKCLQRDPAARYPTAEAVADDLARYRSEPVAAEKPRRRWVMSVAVAAGLLLIVGLAVRPWAGSGRGTDPGSQPGGPPSADTLPGPGPATIPPSLIVPPAGEPRWEQFPIAVDDNFEQLAFPTRDIGFAASRAGVYRTDDAGQTWKRVWAQELGSVHFLSFENPVRGWLGTDHLFETTDRGTTWTAVELPGVERMREVRALVIGPDGWGMTGGSDAPAGDLTLFRRKAGAAAWEKLDPVTAGLWGKDGRYRKWSLGGLATAGPRTAWAVLTADTTAEAGVVLSTTDGGATWQAGFQPPNYLRHVHFADEMRGWLAGFGGTFWTTDDGGRTWAPQANPAGDRTASILAFARGAPFGLAPLTDGQVLLTADGRAWRTVEVGLAGLTPAAAVVDRGRAYVLARNGQVARYTDPQFRPRP
jgi:photosystem II stability/assembly factor-like uncharacterized protein